MTGLFAPLDPSEPGPTTFIGGDEETPEHIASAFLLAADALTVAWGEADRYARDEYSLPILQTYRHAIELFLKASCLATVNSVNRGVRIGLGTNSVPGDFGERLKTHSIAKLVNLLNRLVGGLANDSESGKVPPELSGILASLHQLDNDGLAFRYATQMVDGKWVPIRPEPVQVNLIGTVTRLRDAAEMIRDGYDGWLNAYIEFLSEMESEYAANSQY